MICEHIQIPGFSNAIICRRRAPRRRCAACKDAWSTLECDYPTPARKSGTCDKPLCAGCAVNVGDNLDHCPHHAAQPASAVIAPAAEQLKMDFNGESP